MLTAPVHRSRKCDKDIQGCRDAKRDYQQYSPYPDNNLSQGRSIAQVFLVGPQQVLARAKAFIRNRVETAYRAYPLCRPIQEWVRQARQHELLKKVTGET